MKTLAEFKRNAASGKMSLEIMERYGKSDKDIPARLKGIRKVIKTNTVCAVLLNESGETSELRFGCANLFEYDGETLVIYEPGMRELTDQEQAVLNRIQAIYKENENTYSGGYWKVKDYVKNSPCPWMKSDKPIKGKMFINGKVRDNAIKGNAILRYMVYMDE